MKKIECFVSVCAMICGFIIGGWFSKPVSVAYACSPVTESSYDISDTEAKDAELSEILERRVVSQVELTAAAAQLYKLWDDEINALWAYLRENMDPNEFQVLKSEQIDWIYAKEAAMQEVGNEWKGGSAMNMMISMCGANYTKARVYELLTYVPQNYQTPPTYTVQTYSSEYILPDSNSRYLSMSELTGLSKEQACYARNELYARHGRMFADADLRAYFNSKSWYRGTIAPENFDASIFNQYEKANLELIVQYEKKMHYK